MAFCAGDSQEITVFSFDVDRFSILPEAKPPRRSCSR